MVQLVYLHGKVIRKGSRAGERGKTGREGALFWKKLQGFVSACTRARVCVCRGGCSLMEAFDYVNILSF